VGSRGPALPALRFRLFASRPAGAGRGGRPGISPRWPASWRPASASIFVPKPTTADRLLGQYVAKGWTAWLELGHRRDADPGGRGGGDDSRLPRALLQSLSELVSHRSHGKIDVPTARRVAETCGVDEIAGLRSPRYRLSCCHAGCGPNVLANCRGKSPAGRSISCGCGSTPKNATNSRRYSTNWRKMTRLGIRD